MVFMTKFNDQPILWGGGGGGRSDLWQQNYDDIKFYKIKIQFLNMFFF
jgi:hypothetical protein